MTRLGLMHDLALSVYKLFFSRSSKSAFSRHDNVRTSSTLFIWLNENVGK